MDDLNLNQNLISYSSPLISRNTRNALQWDDEFSTNGAIIGVGQFKDIPPNSYIRFKSDNNYSAGLVFQRAENPSEYVTMVLDGGNAKPRIFSVDPGGTIQSELWFGEGRSWHNIVINGTATTSIKGGGGTVVEMTLKNNSCYIDFGGTTMAQLYPSGDLRIRGSLGTGLSL